MPWQDKQFPWFLWPSILSLDAPSVAGVWQVFVAKAAGVQLVWAEVAILFLGIWLAYVFDRLCDSWSLDPNAPAAPRHLFYYRHQKSICLIWLLVAGATALLAILFIERVLLLYWFSLGVGAAGYFLIVHVKFLRKIAQLFKEAISASIFSMGVFLAPLLHSDQEIRGSLLFFGAFYIALCWLNMLLIGVWEKELDRAQDHISLAKRFPNLASAIWQCALALALSVIVLSSLSLHFAKIGVAIAISALSLAGLHGIRSILRINTLRALADFALLSPLLLIFN